MDGTVHLVRHGEVENPKGIIYGRLPGYHLSERGRKQADAASERLSGREIAAVYSSPLERAQETAGAISDRHGLEIATDDRFIESDSTVEGVSRRVRHFLLSPKHWWQFRNPLRPSWGEAFSEIRGRMLDGIGAALTAHRNSEIVVVSHQTPIQVARLALEKRKAPPWVGLTPCGTGSVTTLVLEDAEVISIEYYAPPV